MTSDPKQILAWIKDQYGEPTMSYANGVHVAVVRIYDGVSIGMGSSKDQSLYDLYCSLTYQRNLFSRPPNCKRWEVSRRYRIDRRNGIDKSKPTPKH